MCGEQWPEMSHAAPVPGSPPRVRGTGSGIHCQHTIAGITPACAGNSELNEIAKLNTQLSAQIKESRIPSRITVARGVKTDIIDRKIKDGIYTEPGFTSTSLSEAQARNFAGKSKRATVLYIDIPKNAPALYLERLTDAPQQYEILLDRGSRFRYLRKGRMPDGTKFNHLELIVDD